MGFLTSLAVFLMWRSLRYREFSSGPVSGHRSRGIENDTVTEAQLRDASMARIPIRGTDPTSGLVMSAYCEVSILDGSKALQTYGFGLSFVCITGMKTSSTRILVPGETANAESFGFFAGSSSSSSPPTRTTRSTLRATMGALLLGLTNDTSTDG